MNRQDRRNLLTTRSNPNLRTDYVVTLAGRIDLPEPPGAADLVIRYVPDKWILDTLAFRRYLGALAQESWTALEDIAAVALDDVNNEVVARWVQVVASQTDGDEAATNRHEVLIEDRQPGWDNPALLSRLHRD